MNVEIRQALLALAESVVKEGRPSFDLTVLNGQDGDSIDLTLKTYGVPTGLATKIHGSFQAPANDQA